MVLRRALSSQSSPLSNLPSLGKADQNKDNLSSNTRPASPQVSGAKRAYRPNRRLNRAERTQLAEQYHIGMPALELARQYGINRHTVVKHLKRDGIAIRGGQVKLTPDMIERAKRLYVDGQSLAAVGEQLGVDASTVHKALKKAGMQMRDTHGRST